MHNLLVEMLDNRFDAANQRVVFLIVASLILTTLSVTVVLCCCKQKKKKKVTSTISPAPDAISEKQAASAKSMGVSTKRFVVVSASLPKQEDDKSGKQSTKAAEPKLREIYHSKYASGKSKCERQKSNKETLPKFSVEQTVDRHMYGTLRGIDKVLKASIIVPTESPKPLTESTYKDHVARNEYRTLHGISPRLEASFKKEFPKDMVDVDQYQTLQDVDMGAICSDIEKKKSKMAVANNLELDAARVASIPKKPITASQRAKLADVYIDFAKIDNVEQPPSSAKPGGTVYVMKDDTGRGFGAMKSVDRQPKSEKSSGRPSSFYYVNRTPENDKALEKVLPSKIV